MTKALKPAPVAVAEPGALAYSVSLYWNGGLVCHAMATGVMAADMVRDYLAGNFGGMAHAEQMRDFVTLGAIRNLSPLQSVRHEWADETGAALAVTARTR